MARSGRSLTADVPRLALSVEEACAALGVGEDLWREHIAADLPMVRCGRRKLVAVSALEAWLAGRGERILDDLERGGAGASLARAAKVPANGRVSEAHGDSIPVADRRAA